MQSLLYGQSWMFTDVASGKTMRMPCFANSAKAFYYVVLAALVLAAIAVVVIQRSRLGRMLQGLSGSPLFTDQVQTTATHAMHDVCQGSDLREGT